MHRIVNKDVNLLVLGKLFFLSSILILILIALGGMTRLTGSGLSIPQWSLVFGILPPLTEVQWNHLFEVYQNSPEFQKINFFMTLNDFKSIFWLEYWHRLIARCIFFLFLTGSLFFIINKNIPHSYKKTLGVILALYMAQGVMGWLMVKSGLSKDASVSPYFLGAHLFLALILYSILIWNGLKIVCSPYIVVENSPSNFLKIGMYGILFLLAVNIFWGALVAGYKAGFLYPTFPKMGTNWIAPESWSLQPFWRNFFENPTGVYAVHRILAASVFIGGTTFCLRIFLCSQTLRGRIIFGLPFIFLMNQIILGALTAVSHVFWLYAIVHQVNAFLLWGSFLGCLFYINSKDCKDKSRYKM